MFELNHTLIESWILEGSSLGLKGLKRPLVHSHLKRCARCRSFALNLVEFSEETDAVPALSDADKELLHGSVMAAFYRERQQGGARRPGRPLLRPNFIKALAGVAFIIVTALMLGYPRHNGDYKSGQAELASVNNPPLPLLPPEAIPTRTFTPTATPTPTPGLKTENK